MKQKYEIWIDPLPKITGKKFHVMEIGEFPAIVESFNSKKKAEKYKNFLNDPNPNKYDKPYEE
jgi:hypothetical protein